ncbi:hypothetical protein CW304_32130 [Bacillus sp. UFRGS-B20]|nr:hypothetical protein CW304_32130 [Bacillus sp. UFRGS-B20]
MHASTVGKSKPCPSSEARQLHFAKNGSFSKIIVLFPVVFSVVKVPKQRYVNSNSNLALFTQYR